jgi:NADH dehydrogenase [ubiquinone] 1 alpha subcomplex assembly factor 7
MNKITKILKVKKSMPLDQFIDLALYNKKTGYYMKKNPFGRDGDYITAPLVSKLFGEMIAIWCISFWEHLGKPKKFIITELGPGDGSLCKDLIETFKNFDHFYQSLEMKLLEKSFQLKKIQKNKIDNTKVTWINSIKELKSGPIIFLCNEFFDSLPIKQFYKKNNFFYEKHIGLLKKSKKVDFFYKKADKKLIRTLKKLNLFDGKNFVEYPVSGINYLNLISKKIKKLDGSILLFDYGYTEIKSANTLQSISKHKYSNILKNPGDADITHLINYNLFFNTLKKNKLEVNKVVTQREFLQKLGIIERANILSKKMNFKTKAEIYYKLKKLLHFKEMGNLFKVLSAQKKGSKFSLGF